MSASLLTQAQREQFTRFLILDERQLAQYYLLNPDDLLVVQSRRDFNRLGHPVQRTVLGHLGRRLDHREDPPLAVLELLSEQLGVDATCSPFYAALQAPRVSGTASCWAAFRPCSPRTNTSRP